MELDHFDAFLGLGHTPIDVQLVDPGAIGIVLVLRPAIGDVIHELIELHHLGGVVEPGEQLDQIGLAVGVSDSQVHPVHSRDRHPNGVVVGQEIPVRVLLGLVQQVIDRRPAGHHVVVMA